MKKVSLAIVVLCILFSGCTKQVQGTKIYSLGETCELHDAEVTLDNAGIFEFLVINEQEILPEEDKIFLVVDVTIRAKSHVYLKAELFGEADEYLTREMSGGISYISNYALNPSVSVSFKLVYTFTEGDTQGYDIEVYGVPFIVESELCIDAHY